MESMENEPSFCDELYEDEIAGNSEWIELIPKCIVTVTVIGEVCLFMGAFEGLSAHVVVPFIVFASISLQYMLFRRYRELCGACESMHDQ